MINKDLFNFNKDLKVNPINYNLYIKFNGVVSRKKIIETKISSL